MVGQAMMGDESSEPSPLSQWQLASPVWATRCQDSRSESSPAVMLQSARRWNMGCLRKVQSTTSLERRLRDKHPRSRYWPSARCPCKHEFYWRGASACCRCSSHTRHPPHPWGLRRPTHQHVSSECRPVSRLPWPVSKGAH